MTKHRIALVLILLGMTEGTALAAEAISYCDNLQADTRLTVETYYDTAYSASNQLCTRDEPRCRLKGLLYKPYGASNAPAVILSHGAGGALTEKLFCNAVNYFTRHEFVVFVAIKRGVTHEHEADATVTDPQLNFQNTGMYYGTVIDLAKMLFEEWPEAAWPYLEPCEMTKPLSKHSEDCLTNALVQSSSTEIGLVIEWLKGQKTTAFPITRLVDPDKIALIGHSNGGKVSIFSARLLPAAQRPAAVVTLSLDEKGWGHDEVTEAALFDAVANLPVPIALFQPANALNVESTRQFGWTLAVNRKRYLAQIFPALTLPADDPDLEVHEAFPSLEESVNRWGPVARMFLAIYGLAP